MSTRYYYRPYTLEVYEGRAGDEDIDVVEEVHFEGFGLYDSRRGNLDEAWVAFSRDPDDAERIVALLNADDRRLAEAATNRARALSINEEPA